MNEQEDGYLRTQGPRDAQAPRLTVAVLQQKGGSGKTTIAVNLAAAAHLEGCRARGVDMDRQGSAFDWSAARRDGSPLEGLTVVRADRPLPLPRLAEITRGFDAVFLDGPPRLGDVTQSAAVAADVAVLPIQPGPFDFWAVAETLESLDVADQIREQLGRPPVRRTFVVNRAGANTKLARDAEAELLAAGGELLGVIRQRVAFPDAAMHGESVLTGARGPAAEDVWRSLRRARSARPRRAPASEGLPGNLVDEECRYPRYGYKRTHADRGPPMKRWRRASCPLMCAVAFSASACRPQAPDPAPSAQARPDPAAWHVDQWRGVTLAPSSATRAPAASLHTLVVSPSKLTLDGLEPPIAEFAAADDRAKGFPAVYKKEGNAKALLVTPLGEALERLSKQDGGGTALAVAFDATTPYRVVLEVLFTAGFKGIAEMHLLVAHGATVAGISPFLPRNEGNQASMGEGDLSPIVTVAPEGFSVKKAGANLAPGCREAGAGIAVPNRGGAFDFAALSACLENAKRSAPAEDMAIISAGLAVPFSTIVLTLDAMRASASGSPLFPKVVFAMRG